jgi:hypothetical protein
MIRETVHILIGNCISAGDSEFGYIDLGNVLYTVYELLSKPFSFP